MEIWKDVVGYEEFYQVSNLGNVRSKDRIIKRSNGVEVCLTSRTLKQRINPRTGYCQVCLTGSKVREKKTMRVYRLVAEAFILNPDSHPTVNHIDGNKLNNNLSNLEWASYSRNSKHAIETGLRKVKTGFEMSKETKKKMVETRFKNGTNRNYSLMKKIAQIDKVTGETINVFDCAGDAAEFLGKPRKSGDTIADVARGRKPSVKTAYGFVWKYVD